MEGHDPQGPMMLALLGFYLVFGVGLAVFSRNKKRPPGPGASGTGRNVTVIHRHLISGVGR